MSDAVVEMDVEDTKMRMTPAWQELGPWMNGIVEIPSVDAATRGKTPYRARLIRSNAYSNNPPMPAGREQTRPGQPCANPGSGEAGPCSG